MLFIPSLLQRFFFSSVGVESCLRIFVARKSALSEHLASSIKPSLLFDLIILQFFCAHEQQAGRRFPFEPKVLELL